MKRYAVVLYATALYRAVFCLVPVLVGVWEWARPPFRLYPLAFEVKLAWRVWWKGRW